jgi:hypothetical protein
MKEITPDQTRPGRGPRLDEVVGPIKGSRGWSAIGLGWSSTGIDASLCATTTGPRVRGITDLLDKNSKNTHRRGG